MKSQSPSPEPGSTAVVPMPAATTYTDVDRVVDVVHRMMEAVDCVSAEQLRRVFTEDVELDLSGVDPTVLSAGPYVGVEEVVGSLMATVGAGMDTFHVLSNLRTLVDGDEARLTAYVSGQHHRPGEGASLATQDHLFLGNRMDVRLRRTAAEWAVHRVELCSRYSVGNAAVLGGPR